MTDRLLPTRDWPHLLRGPILVLGAGGFVGANLFNRLHEARADVFAIVRSLPAWRLSKVPQDNLIEVDLNNYGEVKKLIDTIKPATIFWCAGYGAYSFETDQDLIYRTNFTALVRLVDLLRETSFSALIHAGTSSEYGINCTAPAEDAPGLPNSPYAVSKAAASQFISYAGKIQGLPVANLRLYSVYGGLEDSSRLIPNLVLQGINGKYPPFVDPNISRDFVYIDDVCDAFMIAAARLTPELYGESFNIGSGQKTTIQQLAAIATTTFNIPVEPTFGTMPKRGWDLSDWYSNPAKAEKLLGWKATTPLAEGLAKTADWIKSLGASGLEHLTKRSHLPARRSVTAIIACYKDEQAIPIMYDRLVAAFKKLGIDYEIIFVNDGSPDDCAGAILKLTQKNPRVLGITHSRNFGSQMAFRSGMEMASRDACVLLDGDLQDPPELIEQFHAKWQEGFDVIYGRRIKRDMSAYWHFLYKAFYKIFAAFSYIPIPRDAGDFSLMDKRVVAWLLRCPERDLFMRGLRAYVGFRQTGVDYVRPKRMFGNSTNSFFKNIAWAKRAIFSFSNAPLNMLTTTGFVLLAASIMASFISVAIRLVAPELVPPGVTTVLLIILFFGSINLLAIGIVGEYVAKIMEEVKRRPRLIRSALIHKGEIREILPDESRIN